jgi:hypothetical protein
MKALKAYLKRMAESMGYHIFNKTIFESYLSQRDELLKFLIEQDSTSFSNDSVSCIIFSRDRAAQLYALYESIKLNVKDLSKLDLYVLYSYSSEVHERAYEMLFNRLSNMSVKKIHHNGNNRESLIQLLKEIQTEKLFFLCDDDLLIGEVSMNEILNIDSSKYIYSLRHHLDVDYCYTLSRKMNKPNFTDYGNSLYSFSWLKSDDDWSDPWSIDGQVYLTKEVKLITSVSVFTAPNSFENALKKFKSYSIHRDGLCSSTPKLINLPFNQVQNETSVRHGVINVDYFVDNWIEGLKIDIKPFQNLKLNSIYNELCVEFTNQ